MTDTPFEPHTAPEVDGANLWEEARELYAMGYPGREICTELGLKTATFWRRARVGGWLRRDRKHEAPPPLDLDAPIQDESDAADKAWRRMTQALEAGRSIEAMRWRRLHADLTAGQVRAAAQARADSIADLSRLTDAARLVEAQAEATLKLREVAETEQPSRRW